MASREANELAVIVDGKQMFDSDWEYIEMGLAEGWLRHIGWHIINGPKIVHRYILVNLPEED